MNRQLEIGFVGAGKLGGNLAVQFARSGCAVTHVYARDMAAAFSVAREIPAGVSPSLRDVARKCDVLIIAVPDAQLEAVLDALSEMADVRATFLIHTSGIFPARVLNYAGMDFACASMHPLAGFAQFDPKRNLFEGINFGIEGHPSACALAEFFIRKIGGEAFFIDSERKTTYHFAAALAANAIFGVVAQAEKLFCECGLSEKQAHAAVSSLFVRAAENYTDYGLPRAITGPLVRDDILTLCAHVSCAYNHDILEQYYAEMQVVARVIGKTALFEQIMHCVTYS